MSIDIIIPNFNTSHLIEKNLSSVLDAIHEYNGKIIIVDDGSNSLDKNNLKDIVAKNPANNKISLSMQPENKGFASAVNFGVSNSKADFIVLLNSDVSPDKDFLKAPLVSLASDRNLFGVGCMDESVEEGKVILRGRGVGRWEKGFLVHAKGEVDKKDTFWISGGSSIIRRELFEKIGGMDTVYNPFYWEDIDLSYRARKSGYSIKFDNTSVVRHYHEEGAIKKYFTKNEITTISYRNQFVFVWKNITDWKLIRSHIQSLPLHMISALKDKNAAFLKGFFLALAKLPGIMVRRKNQKKLYKFSDFEIIEDIA